MIKKLAWKVVSLKIFWAIAFITYNCKPHLTICPPRYVSFRLGLIGDEHLGVGRHV